MINYFNYTVLTKVKPPIRRAARLKFNAHTALALHLTTLRV